ncbi:MAG: energy-coupling factor transporter ATPase [Actinomycetota bacterium]|nr:energy-coupling factor transporter ATPase [Actinomycetota bacterium]
MSMDRNKIIKIGNLSYWYPETQKPAIGDINLEIEAGHFILVVGSSGSGKSTLLRTLNGLVPHFYGGKIQGRVLVKGQDTLGSKVRDLARIVGMVFQDPENQFVTDSVESEISFGLQNLSLEESLIAKRIAETTATLRLSHSRGKETQYLSGGEKQKVALASVLAMQPDVLVLDEPTSQLDPVSAEDFLSTLKSLNEELGLTVILSEHRLERCAHFADLVAVLDEGKLAFWGSMREMACWAREKPWVPLPPVTRLFNSFIPLTVKEGREIVGSIASRQGKRNALLPEEKNQDSKNKPEPIVSRNRNANPLLKVSHLSYSYPEGKEALKGVSFEIAEGEEVAIIGENGSGKTTLAKHMNGLLKPTRGKVELCGIDTREKDVATLAQTCGMLGQNPNYHLLADVVEEELMLTLRAMGIEGKKAEELLEEVTETLGIKPLRERNPQELSCGERELVALASVAVYKPTLLVLDEPTRGIDASIKTLISNFIRRYSSQGNSVVVITHELEFAAQCTSRIIMLSEGRIIADGDKHSVLSESLFFTTQFNKVFRGFKEGVITQKDAIEALEAMKC